MWSYDSGLASMDLVTECLRWVWTHVPLLIGSRKSCHGHTVGGNKCSSDALLSHFTKSLVYSGVLCNYFSFEVTGKKLLEKGELKHRYTIIPLNKISARCVQEDTVKLAQSLVCK